MTTSLLDTSAAVRACVFALVGEPFAIDVTQVREVAIVRATLGLPERRGGRKLPTLIVEAEGFEVALVIDEKVSLEAFGGITPLDESSPQPFAAWALGFLPDGERLVPLLDPARLLRALRETQREEA